MWAVGDGGARLGLADPDIHGLKDMSEETLLFATAWEGGLTATTSPGSNCLRTGNESVGGHGAPLVVEVRPSLQTA